MNKYQIKDYSTSKLREIIEKQSNAYTDYFIGLAKDELIKRGEQFVYDVEFEKEINNWDDEGLKNLVENEYNNFNLEYLEIARNEYLKRGFVNQKDEDNIQENGILVKYPNLRNLSNGYKIYAWIIGISTILFVLYSLTEKLNLAFIIGASIGGFSIFLGCLAISEFILVLLDIEENTRTNNKNK